MGIFTEISVKILAKKSIELDKITFLLKLIRLTDGRTDGQRKDSEL